MGGKPVLGVYSAFAWVLLNNQGHKHIVNCLMSSALSYRIIDLACTDLRLLGKDEGRLRSVTLYRFSLCGERGGLYWKTQVFFSTAGNEGSYFLYFTGVEMLSAQRVFWRCFTIITWMCNVSVSVSVQDHVVGLRKAHTRSAPSLSGNRKVAIETAPPFVWLNTDRSRPLRMERRRFL